MAAVLVVAVAAAGAVAVYSTLPQSKRKTYNSSSAADLRVVFSKALEFGIAVVAAVAAVVVVVAAVAVDAVVVVVVVAIVALALLSC